MDTHAVAEALGCSPQHARLLFRTGVLPARKLGRDWFVVKEEIAPYIAGRVRTRPARQLELVTPHAPAADEPSTPAKGAEDATADATVHAVNVAQVPQLSPFRYPGGKTWLVPFVRRWLRSRASPPEELIEPFAGGAIVSLTAVFEGLVKHATLVERDEDVAAVWHAIFDGYGPWLAEQIARFRPDLQSVRRVLGESGRSTQHRAFAAIVRNRVTRGGILAPGAGFVKLGENGKGLVSRWYPETLRRRIMQIVERRDRFAFIEGDGMEVLEQSSSRTDTVLFIDPPYTVAGKRLYRYSEVDHDKLFRLASGLGGDFLMTYDNAEEIRDLAVAHGLSVRLILMKTTHHRAKEELLIGQGLRWLDP